MRETIHPRIDGLDGLALSADVRNGEPALFVSGGGERGEERGRPFVTCRTS